MSQAKAVLTDEDYLEFVKKYNDDIDDLIANLNTEDSSLSSDAETFYNFFKKYKTAKEKRIALLVIFQIGRSIDKYIDEEDEDDGEKEEGFGGAGGLIN